MSERVFLLAHSQDDHDHEGDHHHDDQQECMVALQPSHLPEAAEILDILNKIEFEVFRLISLAIQVVYFILKTYLYLLIILAYVNAYLYR